MNVCSSCLYTAAVRSCFKSDTTTAKQQNFVTSETNPLRVPIPVMIASLLPLVITLLTFRVITSLRFSFYSFTIQIYHWRLSYGVSCDYNIMEIIWMLVAYPYSLVFVAVGGVMEIFNHLICWKWFLLVWVLLCSCFACFYVGIQKG